MIDSVVSDPISPKESAMPAIDPRPGQMKAALASVPAGVPVVMLNLLKFRERAQYPDQASELTGKQAYGIYSKQAFAHVSAVGGEVLFWGKAHAAIIAPEGETWDEMLLVQYPSIEKFVAMVMNPEYQKISLHRTAALEDARLIATVKKG
jgi:uncharacterized protein (DUF1330 family)